MRWWLVIVPALALAAGPELRVERREVAGGAELLTVFGHLPSAPELDSSAAGTEIPFVSLLRDHNRLRYVWVLTSARPSLAQRAAAFLPFFYWRADTGQNTAQTPVPLIDLSATSRPVWTALAGSVTQVMALDSNGALIRSATRSYRNNALDDRRRRLVEALAVLSQLEDAPEGKAVLSEQELLEIQARLTLAKTALGGLVSTESLPEAYFKQRARTEEERGHNWELLRQRAEANGLVFEPLGLNGSYTHALLWIARQDLMERHWDPQFLRIADPYRDRRLKEWTGYTQTRYFDEEGRRTDPDAPSARKVELIPLALYSLDYPKVPLLLVDFRNTHAPRRREMLRRAATDTLSGVLGVSKWGNWPYLAGSWTWNFVTERHGAANNRAARLNAYSQMREWLAMDPSLDSELRKELQMRLEILGVNPLENSVFDEAATAQRQYAALMRYADDPQGLARRLNSRREKEPKTIEAANAGGGQ
jgi:hypothetical protein